MAIDWNKYSQENQTREQEEWTPPKREREMEQVSRRLAVSSRIHPSYLLMIYGYLTEKRGLSPVNINSISDLIYKAVCDYINVMREGDEMIPDPDISLDFLISQGWISADNKENREAFKKIRHQKGLMEQKVLSGEATLKEQYEYWKDRDPEKAEELMQEMSAEVITDMTNKMKGDEEKEESKHAQPNKEEKVVDDNRSGIATLEHLDEIEAQEEQ